MKNKVLIVDDEPNVLDAYRRQLRREFTLDTAPSGREGLSLLNSQGPYPVVVSDLRMPEMNGIQFLSLVRKQFPDTVRLMLTGMIDMEAAVSAVNEGNVFRLLTKPCPPGTLRKALSAANEQYRLVTAERELLGRTLRGTISVLSEILSLVNPLAFSQTSRIKRMVIQIAKALDAPDKWKFELAALLSQIGCVTFPPDMLKKVFSGHSLSEAETQMFNSHPAVTSSLLERIPRLEDIARMIEGQHRPFKDYGPSERENPGAVALGSQILKVAVDFDMHLRRGESASRSLQHMQKARGEYNPAVLQTLMGRKDEEAPPETKSVQLEELTVGMILDEGVISKTGVLLVAKDHEVTRTILERLRVVAKASGVNTPVRVKTAPKPEPVASHAGPNAQKGKPI